MDKVVYDDDNYNELYRLHTGHALFGSDSDSLDEPVLLDTKPPLYTFDELNANLVVIEAASNQNKNDLNESYSEGSSGLETDQIIKEELEKLIFPDMCILCSVYRCSDDIENHIMGKRHRNNVEEYIKGRRKELQNKKDAENVYCNDIQIEQSPDLTKNVKETLPTLQQKLEDLLLPHYCYVCYADLSTPHNAYSHYNSSRHKYNVQYWKADGITSQIESKLTQKLKFLIKLNCCQVCNAKLTGHQQANSHYNSNRHRINVEDWIYKQKLKLQPKNENSDEKLPTSHNITKISVVQKSEPVCKVCNCMVEGDFETHSLLDEHKRNVEVFCFDCNIKTMSKEQLAEHVKGRRHKDNISMQKSSSQSASLDSLPKIPDHLKEVNDILKNKKNYCNLCYLTFGSNADLDTHVKTFPHKEMSTLKSLLVSKGISIPEFWSYKKTLQMIYCSLCNVSIQSSSSAVGHFESKSHRSKFNIWCIGQFKDRKNPNRKWYFCDICNQHLDGTTNIEFHYKGKKHAALCTTQSDVQTATTSKPVDVLKKDTSKVEKILIGSNNSQPRFIEKSSIDKETAASTQTQIINSANKNTNSTQDIPNKTYKEIEPTETIIKNKIAVSIQKLPINSAHKNENINTSQYVADKVDQEIKPVKRNIDENEANKVLQENNKSSPSTKTDHIIYSKISKYCQTEEMEKTNNKSNLRGLEMEMEKFASALNSVPLDVAHRYLQNCTKKLEEGMKNSKVLDVEAENSIENNVCSTKKNKRKKKKTCLNTRVSEVTSIGQSECTSNAPKDKTNNGLYKIMFWSAVGILFLWSLKK